MKEYKHHYTYLIENLNPSTTKQFYIGVKSCDCLPNENIDYMGSSAALTYDITFHGLDQFKKIVLAEFASREEAEAHEQAIHEGYAVAQDPRFYNKKNGVLGFHTTLESTAKHKNTVNSVKWKATTGKEAIRKQKVTKNDPIWKATIGKDQRMKQKSTYGNTYWQLTVGKEKSDKLVEIFNNPTWQETIGQEKARKISETVTDPNWKETVGAAGIRKYKETIHTQGWRVTTGKIAAKKREETVNNAAWKSSIGQEKKRKEKLTKSDPAWIENNTYSCPHCNRAILGRGNLSQHVKGNH